MNNNEIKIINGSYDFTQIYLLNQLLNELGNGNNYNENILDVLRQLLNKEYPTPDLSGITSSINNINTTLNNNDSNVVNAINNINIPEVDLTNVIDAINSLKSNLNNEDININIEEIKVCPQKTIVQVVNEPLPKGINVKVKHSTKFVTPAPKVIKIINKEAHLRVCGSPSPDGKYINCVNCVDTWLKNNPKPYLKDITRSGTGCRVK